jgi:iron complex outermembrane receptor protein
VEFDFTHQPVPWLTIGLGGSYLDAKYVTYQNGAVFVPLAGYAVGTVDLSGTSLPRAPKWTGYATVTAHAPLGNGWTGHLNAAVHHTSSYLFSPGAGGPLGTDVQNSVTLIGGSIGISPGSDRYKISFYVDNLTQEK